MYFISVDELGNIISCCGQNSSGSMIEIDDDSLYAGVMANINNYKYSGGTVISSPAPDQYSVWNGTTWESDPTLLSKAKDLMSAEIIAYRIERLAGGFPFSTYWIESDIFSMIQIIVFFFLGSNIPPGQPDWVSLDGASIPVNQANCAGMFMAGMTFVAESYGVCRMHIANMNASADPLNYDYSAGWPTNYTDGH